MNRTRNLFFLIVGLAVLVVGGGFAINMLTGRNVNPSVKPTPTVALTQAPSDVTVDLKSPMPLFGPNYKAGDGKPVFICGTDAFASFLTLAQIQQSGKDIEHGFHLGIVPLQLPNHPEFELTEEQRDALVKNGKWDCDLNTLDAVATSGNGVMTAIVDESAGGDGMFARNIATLNDLKGKRIAFVSGSSAEYYMSYVLSIARLNPKFDVTLVPADTPDDAVKLFNEGKADAVSAWEPQLSRAKQGGGTPLITTSQLRIIVDVIITSRQAIKDKPQVVQAFHDAWFDALKDQAENFDAAAQHIVKWGYNDWSEVRTPSDLRAQLERIAQGDLGSNAFVMRDPTPIFNRMNISRRIWATAGTQSVSDRVEDLVDPRFVAAASQNTQLQPNGKLINQTFSMGNKLDLSGAKVNTQDAATLAVLPCRRFTFLPESTTLTLESRRILDDCVVPTLQQSVGLFLRVKGSSAWPGPKGTYTEPQIKEFAQARAQSVVDYLASLGLDKARFIVDSTLPPESHWETEDADLQAEDRFVEMTLITVGR